MRVKMPPVMHSQVLVLLVMSSCYSQVPMSCHILAFQAHNLVYPVLECVVGQSEVHVAAEVQY